LSPTPVAEACDDTAMDYDAIAAHFLTPTDVAVAEPMVPSSPARRLRDSLEPIATIGWWSRAAGEGSIALGLDFFGGYVWGRAAALGADVAPSVVVSAFGVFEPTLLTAVLVGARSTATHAQVLEQRAIGAAAGLASVTAGIDTTTIDSLGHQLLSGLATVDGAARPLFSALRGLPVPADPYGRLWRAAELVREHRGDGHLAACVAAGLNAAEMNVMTELWLNYPLGEYAATRGFSSDQLDSAATRLRGLGWLDSNQSITALGRQRRLDIERATDESQRELIDALGPDIEVAIVSAATVSAAILASHAAPADARKRAAG
jgi:hypothetical protein